MPGSQRGRQAQLESNERGRLKPPTKPKPYQRSAGVSPAVAGASRPRYGAVTIRDRGRLPHWEMDAGTYFVTFRLADSLPETVLQQMRRRLSSKLESEERKRQLARAIERYLDKGSGACYLKQAKIAALVADAIRHQDGKSYRLMAWVVMPNHVHLVFRLLPGQRLASVLQALKSYTAHEANRLLGRTGAFWQREYFDHLIRNGQEFDRAIRYVLTNPENAGLAQWKWAGCCGTEARRTAGEDAGATE